MMAAHALPLKEAALNHESWRLFCEEDEEPCGCVFRCAYPNSPFTLDLAAEHARLNDEIKDAKYWPVLQVGLHYKF